MRRVINLILLLLMLSIACQSNTTTGKEDSINNVPSTLDSDTTITEYFKNGNIKKVLYLKDSMLSDVSVEYYSNGRVKKEVSFERDKLHGKSKFYDTTGALREIRNYKDGVQEGTTTFYFESGILSAEEMYHHGKKEGVTVAYHPNGKLFLKEKRRSGMRNGLYQVYYEDGKTLEETGQYVNDKRDGLFLSFYRSGIVKDSVFYDQGHFIEAHTYDSSGVYIESLYPKE